MADFDIGFKIIAREAGQELSRLAGMLCQAWEPIVDALQATERLADRAFRARIGQERFVVYMEAYSLEGLRTVEHAGQEWALVRT
jgi:hypothetical protein